MPGDDDSGNADGGLASSTAGSTAQEVPEPGAGGVALTARQTLEG